MCVQKKFVMYRNVGVQRKVVLIECKGSKNAQERGKGEKLMSL